jgi:hypothetical protein
MQQKVHYKCAMAMSVEICWQAWPTAAEAGTGQARQPKAGAQCTFWVLAWLQKMAEPHPQQTGLASSDYCGELEKRAAVA